MFSSAFCTFAALVAYRDYLDLKENYYERKFEISKPKGHIFSDRNSKLLIAEVL